MRRNLKTYLLAAACASLFLASAPSGAAVLSTAADRNVDEAFASSFVQQTKMHAPAGKRCLKWTRTWNTRHGVARRRCVQWR